MASICWISSRRKKPAIIELEINEKEMKRYLLLLWLLPLAACRQQVPVDDIENVPIPSAADSAFANVYQALDGNWSGDFEVFRDDSRGARDENLLSNPEPSALSRPNVHSIQVIRVRQRYESVTPFFQKVEIRDLYPEDGHTVLSKGVNKVQDGRMWCVVHKPDETVIHQGRTDGPQTIIWQRQEENPQKIEYFRETVSADRYTIIGWGYYEGDDTSLMPPYWYYGVYNRNY